MSRILMKHLLCAVAGLALSSSAFADDATEARLREALRSATEQVQQLQQEKATLQAQKPAPAAATDAKRCERQVAHVSASRAADAAEIAKLQTALRVSAKTAAEKDEEVTKARNTLTEAQQRTKVLEEKNAKLVTLGQEILARYENVGLGEAFGAKEPFIGTTRVAIQNFAQDYSDKIDDNKAQP